TAATVAKELDTTEAKLNAAYASAQKAQAIARVDAALKAGQITEAYASTLKTQINAATFPGFGAGPGGGHHGHGGPDGPGPGPGLGLGFGPPPGSSSSGGSSSSSTLPSLAVA